MTLLEFSAIDLFVIGSIKVTVGSLLTALSVIVLTFIGVKLVNRAMLKTLTKRTHLEKGRIQTLQKLISYVFYMVGVFVALHTVGFNLESVLAAGAVFGVAIGFAMQTIVQNFVSGVILMAENSVHPDDIIMFEGSLAKVEEIRIRSTIVRTLDDEQVIVPNSVLVSNPLKNLTMSSSNYRVHGSIGVHYDSDIKRVHQILEASAATQAKKYSVMLVEFADSSINFDVSIWTKDPWGRAKYRSELLHKIRVDLEANGIEIPYPQIDVHLPASAKL